MAVCGRSRHHPDLPPTVLSGNLRIVCQDWEELYNLPSEKLTDPNVLIEMIKNCNDCGWIEGSEPREDVHTLVDWENISTIRERKRNVPEIADQDRSEDIDEEIILVGGDDGDYETEPMGDNENETTALEIFVLVAAIVTTILSVHFFCTSMTSRLHRHINESANGKNTPAKSTPAPSYTHDHVKISKVIITPNRISMAIDRLSDTHTDTRNAARRMPRGS